MLRDSLVRWLAVKLVDLTLENRLVPSLVPQPHCVSMEDTIAKLVAELDAEATEDAEGAQHALAAIGPQVLDAVIAAVPGLNPFGQLCAIEIFTELGDPRPGDVLIELLGNESATVRQWAGEALGDLGILRAIPALQRAYDAFRQRGEPPDYTEGEGLRTALTELGARKVVMPARAKALLTQAPPLDPVWPAIDLIEVIEDLAAHNQAVLYFQTWHVRSEGWLYWHGGTAVDWEIDRRWPWEQNVAHCRDWAVLAAGEVRDRQDLVATISWIDAVDL